MAPHKLSIKAGRFELDFTKKACIMGVINMTPDSFYDKSRFSGVSKAADSAYAMVRDGADIIDVGGESTRPGADDISAAEEIDRVVPLIENIAKDLNEPISIDTRKSAVAEAALKAGAVIINDVSALSFDGGMAGVAVRSGAALILMHSKGAPKDMQRDPRYSDVTAEVVSALREAIEAAERNGLDREKIIIDPGIGFGKTTAHNLEIMNRLGEFKALGRPVCIGVSRKSFIGNVLGLGDAGDRLAGTIAACVMAITGGANILRVHDVKEAVQAARMAESIMHQKKAA